MHFTFKIRDQLEGNCPSTYNKGGGSPPPTTTTTSGGIDPEFKPYLKDVLSDVTSVYHKTKGDYGDVYDAYGALGTTGAALGAEAAARRGDLSQFEKEGTGAAAARSEYERQMGQDYNQMIADDLAKTAGAGAMGMSQSGSLGSARAQMAQQGAMADRAMQLRAAENAAKTNAAQGLASSDVAQQQRYLSGLEAGQALGSQEYEAAKAGVAAAQGQQEAPHAAATRYFGYLGSGAMPTQQTSTSSGGGGGGK